MICIGLWYRFYDLNTNQGIFSDRTGGKFYDIMDIQKERRDGYRWAGGWGQSIINYANSVGYNGYRGTQYISSADSLQLTASATYYIYRIQQ